MEAAKCAASVACETHDVMAGHVVFLSGRKSLLRLRVFLWRLSFMLLITVTYTKFPPFEPSYLRALKHVWSMIDRLSNMHLL